MEKILALDEIDHANFWGTNNRNLNFVKALFPKLNIIAHDLKHQLGKNNELSEEAQKAVEIYDSMFKTGNKGLDIILTMKNGWQLSKA